MAKKDSKSTTKPLPKGITLRSDGYYMGRFSFYGERHTLYDKDLKKLQRRLDDLRYELEHGLYAKESSITVDDWFHTWLKEYKMSSVKQGTIGVYENDYEFYIKKPLGKKRLKDVRPEHIQSLYNKLNAAGYSHSTIECVSVVLGGMFKQAYKNQIIRMNPVPLTTLPKASKSPERQVFTREQQRIFLEAAKGHRYGYIYELALSTGMRSGEIRGLLWSDVDFEKRVIHVTGTLLQDKGGFRRDLPKTQSSYRDIPMLDNVYQILKDRRLSQAEHKLLRGSDWKAVEGLEDLVVTTEWGTPVGRAYLNNGIHSIVEQIKEERGEPFEYITFHGLRHTFATRCIENDMEPQVLKTIMGHSKLSITMDLYAHVLMETKSKEMQKIAELFQEDSDS